MAKSKGGEAAGMSKMKMVEAALAANDGASPRELQAYIKSQYNTDISTTMLSSYKSSIRRKQGGGAGVRGAALDGSVGVKDVALLRELIDRVGAAQLQTLIKVLSK